MRKVTLSVICLGLVALVGSMAMAGELESNYDEAICKYFGVKQAEVDAVRAQGLSDEDIPVAFHIAKYAKDSSKNVARTRLQGLPWIKVAQGRGLTSKVFNVPVAGNIDSFTYGPIIEKFRSVPQDKWNSVFLADDEVVNMVNLNLALNRYNYDVFKTMAMRDEGKGFVQLFHEVKEAREVQLAEWKAARRAATANAGM